MTLNEEIIEAQKYLAKPLANKSTTCWRVIEPLLLAAGYQRSDIDSHIADGNMQKPDYTILPDAAGHTWHLTAKAWNEPLDDKDAQDALNYAKRNGGRFVVLTNGKLWRLYDNAIQGLAADKFVTQVSIESAERSENFLERIGRRRVTSGELQRFATGRRLNLHLAEQLRDPESKIIHAILDVVKQDSLLDGVKEDDLAAWFRRLIAAKPAPADKTLALPTPLQTPAKPQAPSPSIHLTPKLNFERPNGC